MKTLKRILSVIGIILVLALFAAFIVVQNISNSGKPVYDGELRLSGLNEEVEVIRDERGIPHIYAQNEHDLYMSVGYVMAQDRLWQMDLIRRATTGRLSEIFGPDYVETDLFLRSLKMEEKSKMVIRELDEEIHNAVSWFSEGVNKYIEMAGKDLPPEFKILRYEPEPWSDIYCANIIGYMGWDLASGNLSGDVLTYRMMEELGEELSKKLIPYLDYTGDPVYPGFSLDNNLLADFNGAIEAMNKTAELGLTSFTASNNWAVSGEHSVTGLPLLANDMHLGLSSPGIWVQMHQVIPGKLNVTGVIVPGQPFVIAGHNDDIAWGMTNLMVDDVDLYRETVNEDGTLYKLDGQWLDISVEKEFINTSKKIVEREISYTHRGPIISAFRGIRDAELSMKWAGYDSSNEIKTVYLLNRAASWDEFNEALTSFNAISQNFIYADKYGNIGLHAGGGVALRERHGAFIMPGDTSAFDWKGYVDHYELPYSYNPENGRVSSANNKTVTDDYKYYIGNNFTMPYRINRIRQMLSEKEIFDVEDFKRMAVDRKSNKVQMLLPLLNKALAEIQLEGIDKEVADALSEWDMVMSPDSYCPTFFEHYSNVLVAELMSDDMADFYKYLSGRIKDYYLLMIMLGEHDLFIDNKNTDEIEDLNSNLVKAFYSTINAMTEKYTGDTSRWIWGDLHAFTAEHPMGSIKMIDRLFKLNVGPFRVGGAGHTVSPYSYTGDFRINHGASERHIFNTANWDESYTVIPTGTSGVPSSEFYCSQTEAYCNDEFYKDHFSREAVEASIKYKMLLLPE